MSDRASKEAPETGMLRLLRGASLVAALAGAAGSVALMIRAAERPPPFLLVLFIIWVLAPFAALLWANVASARWSAATRAALVCVTIIVALGTLAIYGDVIDVRPPGSANAFPFVIVPPASILLSAIIVSIVALAARRRSRRGTVAEGRDRISSSEFRR